MLSTLIQKCNWALVKPLLIETYLYLLIGAVFVAVLLYLSNKTLKIKIKWGLAFILFLLLTQFFWYKHSSSINIFARKITMSTQVGVIDQATQQIKGTGQPGFLVYGPYMPLAKGVYKVTFKIKLNNLNAQAAGFCDVNIVGHPENNVRSELVIQEFRKQNPQDIALVFKVPEGQPKAEFRVFQYGSDNLSLDGLILDPAGIKDVFLQHKERFFKNTIYLFGILLFIGVFRQWLRAIKEYQVKRILTISSLAALVSGLVMAAIWQWQGFSHYTFVEYYDMWRVFYAPVWLPLLFLLFNFLYLINSRLGFNKDAGKYLRYDQYTLLALPAFILVEFLVKNINTHILLGNFYLGVLTVKSAIYCIFLWQNLKDQQDIQTSKAVRGSILLSIFSVYMLITPWVNACFYTDGDETLYLLQTQSLIKDNDMDIGNNVQNLDNLSYHPDVSWRKDWTGKLASVTASLLLVPGFMAGGRFGATLFPNAVGALLVLYLFLFIFRITRSLQAAAYASMASAFSVPLGIYSLLLFPEIVGAFIVLFTVYKVFYWDTKNKKELLLIIGAVTFLILLKERYMAVAIAATGLMLFRARKNARMLVMTGAVILAGVIIFAYYDRVIWQGIRMERLLHWLHLLTLQEKGNIFANLLGQLLDQESGLLVYAPVYMFGLLGLISIGKNNWKKVLALVFIIIPYAITVSSFSNWSSAGSPPPRYLVAIIPLLGVLLGIYWSNCKRIFLKLLAIAAAIWSWGMYYFLVLFPQYRVHSPNNITGRNEVLDRGYAAGFLPDLASLWPSFQKKIDTTYFLAVLLAMVFILLAIYYFIQLRTREETFTYPKLYKKTAWLLLILFIIMMFSYRLHYAWQYNFAKDCYTGGGTKYIDDSMFLNGQGFFILTKLALRKGEQVSIWIRARSATSQRKQILNISTGNDKQHTTIGSVAVTSDEMNGFIINYTATRGGLLPFWFEHANYMPGNGLYIDKIVFMQQGHHDPWLGWFNYQLGRLDDWLKWHDQAQIRYKIAENLGYFPKINSH